MSLTGPLVAVVAAGLAVLLPIAVAILWSRCRSGPAPSPRLRRTLTIGGHVLAVVVCEAVAVMAAGVWANDTYGFYDSWADLLGVEKHAPQAPTANGLVPSDGSLGVVIALSVDLPPNRPGGSGGHREPVLVWLPRQYDQPQFRHARFPVTYMMPGQPGTPQGVFREFDFGRQAQTAIDAGRVAPFVAVFPPIMIDPPRDTECTDVPNGPQAESWLWRDVRNAVTAHLRLDPDPAKWSAMGWSTGGFCSAKLLLRHRNLFRAAVGFGAYYDAETDRSTGDLFAGSGDLRRRNSPLWLVQQDRTRDTNLLIVVSRSDKDSYAGAFYADSKKMIAATAGVPGVATILLRNGGHNYRVYRPTLPEALVWLGHNAGL